jgi:hypothetical protein
MHGKVFLLKTNNFKKAKIAKKKKCTTNLSRICAALYSNWEINKLGS